MGALSQVPLVSLVKLHFSALSLFLQMKLPFNLHSKERGFGLGFRCRSQERLGAKIFLAQAHQLTDWLIVVALIIVAIRHCPGPLTDMIVEKFLLSQTVKTTETGKI